MQRYVPWMLMLSLSLVAVSPAWARKWTDNTGRYSVEAELVEVKDGKAWLRKTDGKVVAVPVTKLSRADREHLESIARRGGDAKVDAPAPDTIVPLGKLVGFWRYSAALGPYHEGGQALQTVPDCMLKGDFQYRKRPYTKEVLFADHLSMVRILGGFNDKKGPQGISTSAVRERDLAYRDNSGKIRYRMHLLRPRLQPYIENGYAELTIVLDNVPWCFPERPATGSLGQYSPPRDPKEWHLFIQTFCNELVKILGREQASKLRFRVGTENGGRERFDGTHEEYVHHYENTAAAVRSVLPDAECGCYNISGVSM